MVSDRSDRFLSEATLLSYSLQQTRHVVVECAMLCASISSEGSQCLLALPDLDLLDVDRQLRCLDRLLSLAEIILQAGQCVVVIIKLRSRLGDGLLGFLDCAQSPRMLLAIGSLETPMLLCDVLLRLSDPGLGSFEMVTDASLLSLDVYSSVT